MWMLRHTRVVDSGVNVAGKSSPFVAEVGQHLYAQFADFKAANWINPRRDTLSSPHSLKSSVRIFALFSVSEAAAPCCKVAAAAATRSPAESPGWRKPARVTSWGVT